MYQVKGVAWLFRINTGRQRGPGTGKQSPEFSGEGDNEENDLNITLTMTSTKSTLILKVELICRTFSAGWLRSQTLPGFSRAGRAALGSFAS